MFRKLMIIVGIAVLVGIPLFWYIEQRIAQSLNYLQQNIEERALPVLRQDIPIINKSFMGIPSAQRMLSFIKLGPFSPAKITQQAVGFIEKPFVKKKLEETKHTLNQELKWVKINDLQFKRDGKYKTLTAYCSYGITVIITGKKFKKINQRQRKHLTLTFTCD
jgi:hypothetical protein